MPQDYQELDVEDRLGMEFIAEVPYEEEDPAEDSEWRARLVRLVEDARNWREQHLDPLQEEATRYYRGEPFGNEMEGRSQVVSTDVRDAVQSIMPSLLRVFFGPERVVEFKPRGPEDAALAQQKTDYINYIFMEDNPGFLALHSVLKDAMIRKLGVLKWWWEDSTKVEGAEYTGLTDQEVAILMDDEEVEDISVEVESEEVHEEDPESGEFILVQPAFYSVEITRRIQQGKPCVGAVPSEEFVFSPDARSLEDATMVGHIQRLRADELIAMGVPEDMVERNKGSRRESNRDQLPNARRLDEDDARDRDDDDDVARVQFAELYVRGDKDEDGISELRKVLAIGESLEIWEDYICDEAPFALFGPDPEPHTLIGQSVADYVMDLQRINSAIMRGMLDSLSLSLNPASEVVEDEVNMKDMLNNEVGRIVRVRRPGMIREMTTPFVGQQALPVLQYMQEVKENRLGLSKAAAGLDADALQSSTKAAVAATLSASQQRMEMIARIFAETGMKQMFTGLLKLITRHQDQPTVVRLRNEWVTIDPRHWDADMDVVVNIALGAGLAEEKLQTLALIAGKQEDHLQQGSPLVTLAEYRNTLGRIVELSGYRDSNEFFQPFGPQEQEAYAQQQAQQAENEPPNETAAYLQVEMAKIQARQEEKQAEMQMKMQENQLAHQREMERMTREFAIKEAELQAKHQVQISQAQLQADRNRIADEKTENDAVLGLMKHQAAAAKAAQADTVPQNSEPMTNE